MENGKKIETAGNEYKQLIIQYLAIIYNKLKSGELNFQIEL